MPAPVKNYELHACSRIVRCTGPEESIAPQQQLGQAWATRETALRSCLALDDVSLSWVCRQIYASRPSVQVVIQPSLTPPQPSFSPIKEKVERVSFCPDTAGLANGKESNAKSRSSIESLESEMPVANPSRASTFLSMQSEECDQLQRSFRQRDVENFGEIPPKLTPIVQFLTAMCYCREEAPTVEVAIVRIGATDQASSVRYETRDISAKAGVKYTAQSGTLVFERGEREKFIYIPTTNDEAWDATLEFEVILLAEGLVHAQLGRYLFTTRVKIIDDDYFPTNRFAKLMDAEQFGKISTPLLMWEYFKMNSRNKVVRRGLTKKLLADQVGNLYFILCLFLARWMIDFVLCDTCDKDGADGKLLLIVCCQIIPFPIMHFLDYSAVFWKIGGASRMTLQANLLRKYLAYDEASLAHIDQSKLTMAMTRDATDIAEDAFCKIPVFVSCLLRLAMLLAYQIVCPIALGVPLGSATDLLQRFAPTLIFPVVMVAFLKFRNRRTLQYLEVQKRAQNDMLLHIRRTIECFNLIRDYRKRGAYVDIFIKRIAAYNGADVASKSIQVNNRKFAEWCAVLICALYTQIGGMQVVSGGAQVGAFLNNLSIYKALGEMWGKVYEVLLEMQNVFDALTTMVEYLNLPTEMAHRLEHYESNMTNFSKAIEKCQKANTMPGIDPVDQCCIELRDLTFAYKTKGHISNTVQHTNASFVQGGLYAMVGPPSQGKGTVLRLLGEVLIPFHEGFLRNCDGGGGCLVIPTHLRALHVSKDPMFVEGSLRFNMTFGCGKGTDDHNLDRVMAICEQLHVPGYLMKAIREEDGAEYEWGHLLSSTDAALLHVARALITNPEILCIHKPALFLNTELSNTVYKVLKEFVSGRGLVQDPAEFYHRRPRTCVVTARRVEGPASEVADAVFKVTKERGMEFVSVSGEHSLRLDRMSEEASRRSRC